MTEPQSAADVLMVRPANFCANAQTMASNRFQRASDAFQRVHAQALDEFDALAVALRHAGVRVHVVEDTPVPQKPDAIFPNNWFSSHVDGTVVLYPMLAPNRRPERRRDILDLLDQRSGFDLRRVIDLSTYEREERYLEGTGSLVLDRCNRVAYACHSPRTDAALLAEFARQMDYEIVAFDAGDESGQPIYHTNVLLSIGTDAAVVCTESIRSDQRRHVADALRATGHRLVEITHSQMHNFAANAMELTTSSGNRVLALSARAAASLTKRQTALLNDWCGAFVTTPIPTVETFGGGSVRCMLAEVAMQPA